MRREDGVRQGRLAETSLTCTEMELARGCLSIRDGNCRRKMHRGPAVMRVGIKGSPHTNADDVELETALQELALNLGGDAVETDMAVGEDGVGHGRHKKDVKGDGGLRVRERGRKGARTKGGEGPSDTGVH